MALLAETAVDIANDKAIHSLDKSHYGQIFDESVEKGHTVFDWLIVRECKNDKELGYLEGFRDKDYQPEPEDREVRQSLRHRQLCIEENGQWRLRAPLMGRWLKRN